MIANRELAMEDYLAIARRRLGIILMPVLPAALLAFAISFAFAPKYTSRSLLLVEPQLVPTGYVKPIITDRVSDRMTALLQSILSRSRLQPLVTRLGLVRQGESEDEVIDTIGANLQIVEADRNGLNRTARAGIDGDVTSFYVKFTAANARKAQQVCAEITSLLLEENLEARQQVARSTTDFLAKQLEQAKQNLDALDHKLSEFKKLHLGQLPSDEEKNFRILTVLTSQLDANTQALSRSEEDKSFAESELSQQWAALHSYRAAPNLPPLRQKLAALQNQLIELQSRYTEDHPDIARVKKDIAEITTRLRLAAVDPDAEDPPESAKAKVDPPEILQLRERIHQDEFIIERVTRDEKRLQQLVASYQARLSLSPDVEEQYAQLTRDYATAHGIYNSLLTNKSSAEMQTEMEREQQGEQVKLLDPASFPIAPSFPVRWKFAGGGLSAGLVLGLAVSFWKELQDKAIRNEGDVAAALELPMLALVPWLGPEEEGKVHRPPQRTTRGKRKAKKATAQRAETS